MHRAEWKAETDAAVVADQKTDEVKPSVVLAKRCQICKGMESFSDKMAADKMPGRSFLSFWQI